MSTKPVFVDYQSKICSAFLNPVADAVWDALGEPKTPNEARQNIGAVEEAPNDGSAYVRKNLDWLVASAAVLHNDLGGRSDADAHPQSAVTGLETRLDNIETKNTSQDSAIALKADKTYVDSENDAQDLIIAAKADKTYVDSENDAQDLIIAAKADKSYVDAQNLAQDATTLALIIALG
jgi:hypothetical protein